MEKHNCSLKVHRLTQLGASASNNPGTSACFAGVDKG